LGAAGSCDTPAQAASAAQATAITSFLMGFLLLWSGGCYISTMSNCSWV
jgi:hypothetical protein